MPAKLPVLRTDHTAKQLREFAMKSKFHSCRHRLRAIASVIEDQQLRAKIAQRAAVDPQTLRDWVERYNNEGVDGLKDKPRSGRPQKLDPYGTAQFHQSPTLISSKVAT